jgi:hypothetical protein
MSSEWMVEDEADEYSLNGEPLRTYTNPDCVRFVADMEQAGLTVEHYFGRFFWQGPAVRVDDLQDAMSETRVKVQYDNMGRGYIVYPKSSDNGGVK